MSRTYRKREFPQRYIFSRKEFDNSETAKKRFGTYEKYLVWINKDHPPGFRNAPKFFRRILNQKKRAKAEQEIKNWYTHKDIDSDIEVPCNRNDANWFWF
jgi:hypothetical protein